MNKLVKPRPLNDLTPVLPGAKPTRRSEFSKSKEVNSQSGAISEKGV
jgi:hypothetical protein